MQRTVAVIAALLTNAVAALLPLQLPQPGRMTFSESACAEARHQLVEVRHASQSVMATCRQLLIGALLQPQRARDMQIVHDATIPQRRMPHVVPGRTSSAPVKPLFGTPHGMHGMSHVNRYSPAQAANRELWLAQYQRTRDRARRSSVSVAAATHNKLTPPPHTRSLQDAAAIASSSAAPVFDSCVHSRSPRSPTRW